MAVAAAAALATRQQYDESTRLEVVSLRRMNDFLRETLTNREHVIGLLEGIRQCLERRNDDLMEICTCKNFLRSENALMIGHDDLKELYTQYYQTKQQYGLPMNLSASDAKPGSFRKSSHKKSATSSSGGGGGMVNALRILTKGLPIEGLTSSPTPGSMPSPPPSNASPTSSTLSPPSTSSVSSAAASSSTSLSCTTSSSSTIITSSSKLSSSAAALLAIATANASTTTLSPSSLSSTSSASSASSKDHQKALPASAGSANSDDKLTSSSSSSPEKKRSVSDSEYESSELRIDLGDEEDEEGNDELEHDDEDEQIYIDDEADDGESRAEDLDSDLSSLHGSDKRKYKEFDEESVSSLNDMGVNLLKKLKYKFDSTYEDSSSCDTNATSNGKGLPILKSMLSPIDQTSEKIGKSNCLVVSSFFCVVYQ